MILCFGLPTDKCPGGVFAVKLDRKAIDMPHRSWPLREQLYARMYFRIVNKSDRCCNPFIRCGIVDIHIFSDYNKENSRMYLWNSPALLPCPPPSAYSCLPIGTQPSSGVYMHLLL